LSLKKEKFPFSQVFQKASKISGCNFAILAKPNNLDYPRIAVMIARRNVKNATDRNRIKRVIKECTRANQEQIKGNDILVIGYKSLDKLSNKELTSCLEKKWQKLPCYQEK
jgi:ribonuclease P protein component